MPCLDVNGMGELIYCSFGTAVGGDVILLGLLLLLGLMILMWRAGVPFAASVVIAVVATFMFSAMTLVTGVTSTGIGGDIFNSLFLLTLMTVGGLVALAVIVIVSRR